MQRVRPTRQVTAAEGTFVTLVVLACIATGWSGRHAWETAPDLFALALAGLLMLELPALAWFLVLKRRGFSAYSIVPIAVVGALIARVGLPPESRPEAFLAAMGSVLLVGQIGLIAHFVLVGVRRTQVLPASGDLLTRTMGWVRVAWPGNRLTAAIAYELVVLAFAFGFRWPGSSGSNTDCSRDAGLKAGAWEGPFRTFTIHRTTGLLSLLWALLLLSVVELFAAHIILSLWSARAAWIASGIEAYGVIWVVGFIRSIERRPIKVSGGRLMLRFGLLYDAEFELDDISTVDVSIGGITVKRTPDVVLCAVLNSPNILVTFARPVDISGPYGRIRKVKQLALLVDDPTGLARAIA